MKRRIIVASGLLGLLTAAPVAPGQTTRPAKPAAPRSQPARPTGSAPQLVVSTAEWDFGKKWRGEDCSTEIKLTNRGDAPLRILRVRKSCGCTPAEPKSGGSWSGKVLRPGASEIMLLSYDTTRHARKVSQTVALETNDPRQPRMVIQVKGEVNPLFEADPQDQVYFKRIEPNETATESIELRNSQPQKVSLELGPPDDSSPFDVKLEEIEPGMVYRLSATTRPPLSLRANRATVVLKTSLDSVPRLEIPIRAYVQPRVSVRPPQWLVSPRVTTSFRKRVYVRYRPDQPIEITDVKSTHPDLVQAKLLPPRKEARPQMTTRFHELEVTIPPYDELPKGGVQVEIYTDDPSPEYRKLIFKIRKQSVAPRLSRHARRNTGAPRETRPKPAEKPERPEPSKPNEKDEGDGEMPE